jgi:hypothetical protein
MGGLTLYRNMGVLRYVKRLEPVIVGKLGSRYRRDTAIAGEQHKPVVHG